MKTKCNRKRGFTLIELCVTIGLLTLVGGLCASLIISGFSITKDNAKETAFQNGLNLFIADLNSKISSTENGNVAVNVDTSNNYVKTIMLTLNGTDEIVYTFIKGDGALYYSQDGSDDSKICTYLREADFDYDLEKHLLTIKLQSDLDGYWVSTSFYIR